MTGLYHTLNIGAESLYATRQGVDTAGHNIANAQVEGYSRQRVNIHQRDPLQTHGVLIGNGAYVGSISRSHDKFVESRLNLAHQEFGRAKARAEGMKNIEQVFSPDVDGAVPDQMTKFFNSLETLSNMPADDNARMNVLEAGKDVADAFRRVDSNLKDNRAALNERVGQVCSEVTDALQEVANLNIKIQVSEAGEGQQANDLRDQRDKLVRDLSQKIDLKYYDDKNGMICIRGPDQVTLVDGGHASKVDVLRGVDDGMYRVTISDWEGHTTRDVTDKMDGGALDALVEMRDKDLNNLLAKNNQMAYTFANAVNEAHQGGFGVGDFAEHTGRNFFTAPTDIAHAAEQLDVDDIIKSSRDAIAAASSPLAPGDNVNLNNMIKLKDAKLFPESGNTSLNEFYASYTGNLGLDVVRADHISEAHNAVVNDLNQRREAVSGVSLDEEATNMMKWQANFTASSKVITTVDEMLDTVLQLKR